MVQVLKVGIFLSAIAVNLAYGLEGYYCGNREGSLCGSRKKTVPGSLIGDGCGYDFLYGCSASGTEAVEFEYCLYGCVGSGTGGKDRCKVV